MSGDIELLHGLNDALVAEVRRLRKRWTDRVFRPWDKRRAVRINIRPKSKARPRWSRRGHTYMPKPYTDWVAHFQDLFLEEADKLDIRDAPTSLYIVAHVKMPKSWTKKRKRACKGRPHTNQRLDIDNMAGAVMDAIYPTKRGKGGGRDPDAPGGDGHVWRLQAAKVWDDEDYLELVLETQEKVVW